MIKIPAKTFLCGEYAVINDEAGIVLTTSPCFGLSLTPSKESVVEHIHPHSPAGLWLAEHPMTNQHLRFDDPYQGAGGLGASTAQFLAVYKAYHQHHGLTFSLAKLYNDYLAFAWNGQGLPPSGYDLIAQAHHGIVYYQRRSNTLHSCHWPFKDVSWLLLRTGKKLATHTHLQQAQTNIDSEYLGSLSQQALKGLQDKQVDALINVINHYQQALERAELSAEHTLILIDKLKQLTPLLAIKGCGAMGADILLVLYEHDKEPQLMQAIATLELEIVASTKHLFTMPTVP